MGSRIDVETGTESVSLHGSNATHFTKIFHTGLLGLVLTACGGGGERPEPLQAGLVPGQGTSDATLQSITARGGTEFFLNGENSDGVRFPIDTAVWRQTDNTGIEVRLDKRTEFTRAVQLPFVDEPTELTFELTATNEANEQSVTPVSISVVPASDGNRFLEFVTVTPNEYTVVAALKPGVQTLTEVDFTITQTRLADYPARDGSQQTDVPFGTAVSRSSSWLSDTLATHTSAIDGVNAPYHPNVCFDLPRIDADDINVSFDDTPNAGQGVPDDRRDEISQRVELNLEVGAGDCLDSNDEAIACQDAVQVLVLATNGQLLSGPAVETISDTQIRVNVESLAASSMPNPANGQPASTLRQPESATSAAAYYAAVDPNNLRTTLADWLDFTGFEVNGEPDPNAGTEHVTYINNFDLGFTRDMFLREDGDKVFAYVTNYPALRTATFQTDVLATVAMEFGPPDQTPDVGKDQFIVKFFVFVPENTEPGATQNRVMSLNFDGRGEKWVPGACMPCHGGKLRDLEPGGTFPGFGNTEAAFLPWDLDTFLFADSDDPEFQDPVVVAGFELNPGYIRREDLEQISLEAQQDSFRRMNEGVLKTLNKDDGRFDLVRRQIHGWYGNCEDPLDIAACNEVAASDSLPENDFNGLAFIQPGWEGNEDVYHEVFSKHCRVCHSQAKDINQFLTFDDLVGNRNTVPYLYEDGVMPNARLDMDRFWVDFRGASEVPAVRLGAVLGVDVPEDGPGAPIARIRGDRIISALPRDLLSGALESRLSDIEVENDNSVRLDGSVSAFADTYAWEILSSPPGSTTRLVGANTAKPAFQIDQEGTYEVGLVVSNARGVSAQQTITVEASVASPQSVAGRIQAATLEESIPGSLSSVVISNDLLQFVDADSAPEEIFFTITQAPENGVLMSLTNGVLSADPATNRFTQAEVDRGEISYEQSVDRELPTDSFAFDITDAEGGNGGSSSFMFTITTRNDAPALIRNGPVLIDSGASVAIDEDVLFWRDFDVTDPDVTFTLTRTTAFGALTRDGVALVAGQTFTQSEVSAGAVQYSHDVENIQPVDSFDYNVTHGNVTLGPQTFTINVSIPQASPQLATTNFEVEAGLAQRITGGFAGAVTLRVTDLDTTSADDIILSVVQSPTSGRLETRDAAGVATTLAQGDEFPLSVTQLPAMGGLFYVSTSDPSIADSLSDSFELSLRDSDNLAGACLTPAGDSCVVSVTTQPRSDGPMGPTDVNVMLSSLFDPARARTDATSPLNADQLDTLAENERLPWNDVVIDSSVLNFTPAEGLTFSVMSYSDATRGFLKTGDEPLNRANATDALRVLEPGDTFALPVYYANREVPDNPGGLTPHELVVAVSAAGITREVTLRINPAIEVQTDIGWLIDSTFARTTSEAVNLPACSAAGVANGGPRACRECHTNVGCGVGAALWKEVGEAAPAAGTIQCDTLAARFGSTLPDRPTLNAHSGGQVFPPNSVPHDLLRAWNGECP